MNSTILIVALIVGAVFALFVLLVTRSGDKKRKDDLKNLISDRNAKNILFDDDDDNPQEEAKKLAEQRLKSSADYKKKLKASAADEGSLEGLSPTSIKYMIIQAGLEMPVWRFWVYSVVSGVLFFFLTNFFGFSTFVQILMAFTGFFGFPRFVLRSKVNKRQKKYLEEFADCLEAMMRLLKSGMPISEAIVMVSREFSGPIGEEMTKVYEAQKVGDTLPDAVQKMAFRVPLPEVKMFATAVTIQTQTGSSLSEVLQNLANVIRQRFRLKRKVQALSAEAKVSAGIIAALPCVVVLAMYFLNTEYIMLLVTTPLGKMLTYGAIGWMGCGVFIMRQMINFKV